MPYITRLHVENCRNVRRLDIDLSVPQEPEAPAFRHLILTGPNGSGKSGVLEAVASQMVHALVDGELAREILIKKIARARVSSREVEMDEEQSIELWWSTESGLSSELRSGRLSELFSSGALIAAYVPAKRLLGQQRVPGPSKVELGLRELLPEQELAPKFLQFLVNKRTELAYAIADGDRSSVERIGAWFAAFERHLRRIMEDDGLVLEFDRANFTFLFRKSDGYTFSIQTLADGHAAILALLAELFIRVDAVQRLRKDSTFEPEGVVVIDEIETHLHLKLQEEILPLLTELFPKVQFLVATHSPAVIASIPSAVVYDFAKKSVTLSDDLRGVRYGRLMKEHFGISSEIDLDSTEKLLRLRELARKPARTADEERDFTDLAAQLSARSHELAVEVWMIKERLDGAGERLAAGGELDRR